MRCGRKPRGTTASTYFILLAYTRTMLRSTFTAVPGSIVLLALLAELAESWKEAR